MADSLDLLVKTVLVGGTQKVTSNAGAVEGLGVSTAAATNTLTTGDTLKSAIARFATVKLRAASITPWRGELYAAVIHPDVSHDLRAETGADSWREPHENVTPENIWAGDVGTYEGAFYIETPRAHYATDGAASKRVYRTLYLGRDALAEAVAEEPHSTVSEKPVDYHNRNYALGWYGFLGWNRFYEESIIRVETVSTLA